MTIYEKIKKLCEKEGFPISSIGEKIPSLHISKASISGWKKGATPRPDKIKAIADFFGVGIEYFCDTTINTKLVCGANVYPTSVLLFDVIGKVCAGYDGQAVEEYTGETEYIPTELLRGLPKEDYFVLEVKGDSMYPKLLDGDRVLVHRTDSVDSGSIAIVLYDGDEATIKKVVYENGCDWIDLIPLNSKYQPKRISGTDLEQCRILGKVVNLTRKI